MKRVPGRERLRVALISFDFGEYCVPIANELAREADVCLLLPEREVEPVRRDVDAAVHLQAFRKPRLRQPLRQARTSAAIVRHVVRFRPDVVHLQQGHLWFNLFLPLLRRYPLVVTIHDPKPHLGDRGGRKTPTPIMRFGFQRASRVIVHAERLKPELVEQGVSADAVDVIPHVAVGDRTPAPGVAEEDGLVLFFGRIWPYKGLEYLIRAERLIALHAPEARIIIAGEGENLARYRRMMARPDRFVIHNEFVSNEKRAELFARASVVVLPYVEASQSGVVPVAYSFAKPVVATAVGGLPEVVEDGRTGLVVPPRDEHALAAAIVRLLADPALRHRLGTNGKRKLETEWSAPEIARRTLAVYAAALARPHQSTPVLASGDRPRPGAAPKGAAREAVPRPTRSGP